MFHYILFLLSLYLRCVGVSHIGGSIAHSCVEGTVRSRHNVVNRVEAVLGDELHDSSMGVNEVAAGLRSVVRSKARLESSLEFGERKV